MKICGIVAEYNPFHNGHAFQAAAAREATGGLVISVMSGSFTQRGLPAILDKWTRARMALLGRDASDYGKLDAVIELPVAHAVAPAEGFARGAIRLLDALGATHLCFGSEIDNLALLQSLASLLNEEPLAFSQALSEQLALGFSYPRAMHAALAIYLQGQSKREEALAALSSPNATLAIEYLRALEVFAPHITPILVKRKTADYHEAALLPNVDRIASATAIRNAADLGRLSQAASFLPVPAQALFQPPFPNALIFDAITLHTLRTMSLEKMLCLPYIESGLAQRLHNCVQNAVSRDDLLLRLKSKRHAYARLSRLLTHALLGLTASDMVAADTPPVYARVLGARKGVMSRLSHASSLPLLARPRDLRTLGAAYAVEAYATDTRAVMILPDVKSKPKSDYEHHFLEIS